MTQSHFETCVALQIALLNAGKPLEAFDRFFAPSGLMFANDELFANCAEVGRKKQELFISAATSITGRITDLKSLVSEEVCVFKNKSMFSTADGAVHHIDGLCWQNWSQGQIIQERYYDGDRMNALIANGILLDPGSAAK